MGTVDIPAGVFAQNGIGRRKASLVVDMFHVGKSKCDDLFFPKAGDYRNRGQIMFFQMMNLTANF